MSYYPSKRDLLNQQSSFDDRFGNQRIRDNAFERRNSSATRSFGERSISDYAALDRGSAPRDKNNTSFDNHRQNHRGDHQGTTNTLSSIAGFENRLNYHRQNHAPQNGSLYYNYD